MATYVWRAGGRRVLPSVRLFLFSVLFLLLAPPAFAAAEPDSQTVGGSPSLGEAEVQGGTQASGQARGPYVRHPEAVKAIDRLKSPYCPGMLEVCSSGGGAALRDSIEMLADDGWAADSIVAWVLANHGEDLLALPPMRGKALVAWVVPPLAVLMGLGLVILALQRMRRSRPSRAALEHDLSPEDEEQLREALRELEAEEEVPFL